MVLFVKKLVMLIFSIPVPFISLVIRSDALRQFFKVISESAEQALVKLLLLVFPAP
jgi:hypothetical protein